jgi:hypothetical protein
MVPQMMTRVVSAAAALAVTAALAIGAGPATAAPKPAPRPTAIYIEGKGIKQIVVQQQADTRFFANLLGEVNWMANARPQTGTPKADKLGPKYTVTVLVKTAPVQVYDVYPLAAGGPRAHRPAKQPSGKKADGWFYGRLTLPESLRVSGVPLKAKPDVVGGGIGGGVGEKLAADEVDPVTEVNNFLEQMRRLFLLNGAILIVILFGLAGISFFIRRRV